MSSDTLSISTGITSLVLTIVLCVLGFIAFRRRATLSQFYLEDGKVTKRGPIIGTLVATNLSLGNFIFVLPVFGFYGGLSALWLVLVVNLLAPIGFLVFSNRFRPFIEDRSNSGTVHQFIADNTRSPKFSISYKYLRTIASFATVSCLVLALVLEMHFAAILLNQLMGMNELVVFACLVFVVCLYTAAGGFRAVLTTDSVQALAGILGTCVLIGFMGWILFWSPAFSSVSLKDMAIAYGPLSSHLVGVGWPTIVGFAFIGFGWAVVGMDNWQRCCATRAVDISRQSVVIGFVLVGILAVLWTGLGIVVRLYLLPAAGATGISFQGGENPVMDVFALHAMTPTFASVALGVLGAALLMAGVSTADTFYTVASHSIVSDLVVGGGRGRDYGDLPTDESQRLTWIGRGVIMLLGVCSIIVWLIAKRYGLLTRAADLFFVAYSVQYALFAPILWLGVRRSLGTTVATVAIVAGAITAIGLGVYGLSASSRGILTTPIGFAPSELISLGPLFATGVGLLSILAGEIGSVLARLLGVNK